MIKKFSKIVRGVTSTLSVTTGLLHKTPSWKFATAAASLKSNSNELVEILNEQLKQEEELYNPDHSSRVSRFRTTFC